MVSFPFFNRSHGHSGQLLYKCKAHQTEPLLSNSQLTNYLKKSPMESHGWDTMTGTLASLYPQGMWIYNPTILVEQFRAPESSTF